MTSFVRDRKLDVTALVWALLFGFVPGNNRAIEELRRTYLKFANYNLCPSSFHDRLTWALAALLRGLIEEAMAEMPTPHTMTDSIDHTHSIVITDATIIRLYKVLGDTFPATHDDLTGAKLHIAQDVTDTTIDRLDSTDERTHDSTPFEKGSWLQGRLVLLDLAHFKYRRFALIDENVGFFVSRLKRNANPEIVAELRSRPSNTKPFVGEQVWDVTSDLYRQGIDVLIEVTFNRGPYRGTRSTDTRTFRVVGRRNDATGEYHCYITNLSDERFSPDHVAALYRARWEVELLLRDLKRVYVIDEVNSSEQEAVESLILIDLLSVMVSRTLNELFIEIIEAQQCDDNDDETEPSSVCRGSYGLERSIGGVIGFSAKSPDASATSRRVSSSPSSTLP